MPSFDPVLMVVVAGIGLLLACVVLGAVRRGLARRAIARLDREIAAAAHEQALHEQEHPHPYWAAATLTAIEQRVRLARRSAGRRPHPDTHARVWRWPGG